jgi:hypothetical protein
MSVISLVEDASKALVSKFIKWGVYIHFEVSSSMVGNEELNCSVIILLVHLS